MFLPNPVVMEIEANSLRVYLHEGREKDFTSFFIDSIDFLLTFSPEVKAKLVTHGIFQKSTGYDWVKKETGRQATKVFREIIQDYIVEKFIESSSFLSIEQVSQIKSLLQQRIEEIFHLPSGDFAIDRLLVKRCCKDLNITVIA